MNELSNGPHPEEQLGAFALHALNEAEAKQIEAHLDTCVQCRQTVSELQDVVARLGQSVVPMSPPSAIHDRVVAALPRPGTPTPPSTTPTPGWGFGGRLSKLLAPVAAVLVLALAVSLVFNFRWSSRIDGLEVEKDSLSAQLLQVLPVDTSVPDKVQEQEVASYLQKNPANQPVVLEPPHRAGEPRGVLLVADDGRQAILMVSGMKDTPTTTGYMVLLVRPGWELPIGEVDVDSRGWGTMVLSPSESLFHFDRVELWPAESDYAGSGPETMILEGTIASQRPPE